MNENDLRLFFERMQQIRKSGVERPYDIYNNACYVNGEKICNITIDTAYCVAHETLAMHSLRDYNSFLNLISAGAIEFSPVIKEQSKGR